MKRQDDVITGHDEELLRYVDDRLDVDDRAAVEQRLRNSAEDAQRVREWRAHKHALLHHYDPLAHAAVPERLLRAVKRASHRSPMRYAAAIGWLVVGALVGYGIALATRPATTIVADGLAKQAAIAYAIYVPEIRHPVEVGADQEAHLTTWLSKKLGDKLIIPKLTQQGFSLVGGRLLPSEAGPVALFMYQNLNGQRLTLYVRTNKGGVHETAFRFAQEGNISVFYWLDDNLGCALSGEVDKSALLDIAQTVYLQLNQLQ
ncbi:MAG TPA: anti-sigma factor [Rhodocyclaceae bacterium]|nr:anti-sigma factor [Rhodocyclaceae bacterium]